MRLGWSASHHEAYEKTLALVQERLGSRPAADGARQPFDRNDWKLLGELGFLGLLVDPDHGGGGHGAVDTAARFEALGRACHDTGLVFAAAAHLFACVVPVAEFAAPATRDALLPGLCGGDLVAANAMTEPDAGSDVGRLGLRATRVDGGWRLDGEKSFASNAPAADVLVTYATSDPDAGFLGQTAFAVDASSEGITVSEPFAKMGLGSCPAGSVTFDGCVVGDDRILGAEGSGGAVFQHSMRLERALLPAAYLGLMDRLVDESAAHARDRRQFGEPISGFQAVSHRLADMRLRLEQARLLLTQAARALDDGDDAGLPVALAKLGVSEAAVEVALDAQRTFGGAGYLRQAGIEEAVRDCLPTTVFSGTSDLQRELIAQGMGL